MKELITQLNKVFDHRVRLGIMSALVVNDSIDFTSLRELLGVTDGNLASHLKALEKENYIEIQKQFINRKPNTSYMITKEGRKSFEFHLSILEKLIKNQ